ncbi:MAG: autotransporter outer membrane beta-barrel domain-containing protein, partial [Desulfarculus sp.]|nr:autotransporter outer membrane beta-barrel domain-containing protein [Desulfarculus sp.]
GNSIGTLTIDGDFINSGSGVLAVELGLGSGDRLVVTGTAYLNGGTLRAALEPGVYTGGTSWTVLSAGNIVGGFSSFQSLLDSVVLSLSMGASSDCISITLSRASYAQFGQTANQRVVGGRLDDIVPLAVDRDDEMATLITAMDFAYSAAQISAALEQLSPEMYSAFAWSALQSAQAFGDVIDQQMDQERDALRLGTPTAEGSPQGLNLWARFWGSTAQRQGDAQNLGYGQTLDGVALGGDGALAPWLNLGLALGVSRGELSWDRPSYYGRMDNFHAGLYAKAVWGALYLRGQLGLAYNDSTAHRSLNLASYNGTARSDFQGLAGLGSLKGGYDFKLGGWQTGPTAMVRYTGLKQDGFSESGVGALGLAVEEQDAESMQSALGWEASTLWELGGVRMLPRLAAAWWHEFKDDPLQITARFEDYGVSPLTVDGLKLPSDYGVASIGFSALLSQTLEANLALTLALGDDYYAQAVTAGLEYRF